MMSSNSNSKICKNFKDITMKKQLTTLALSSALIFALQGCGNSNGKKSSSEIETHNTDAPVIELSVPKTSVNVGESVVLDASSSYDTNGRIVNYIWKDKDGRVLATSPKLDRLFTEAGTYTMVLEIIDDQGVVSTKEVTIKVDRNFTPAPTSLPPIAKARAYVTRTVNGQQVNIDITDTVVYSGELIHFVDDGSYDPDGSIVKYEWRDMDGILLSSQQNLDRKLYYFPEYDLNNDGTTCYKKTLYVTDNDGNVRSTSIELCVKKLDNPQPPSVVIQANPGTLIKAGQSVTLTALADDPDGVILPEYTGVKPRPSGNIYGYTWKDENGNVLGHTPMITLDNLPLGQHTFYVTVEDNDGEQTTTSITINVTLTGASGG